MSGSFSASSPGGQRQPTDRTNNGNRFVRAIGQVVWIALPVFSLGLLAWVPAGQVWYRARTVAWFLTAAVLLLASAGILVAMAASAAGAGYGMLLIATMAGGAVAAATGRNVVFGRRGPDVDPALQKALDNRARRSEARALSERDPQLALDLHIGRPDRPRDYDDGGLVDLNNASADSIVYVLGWDATVARAFVEERDARLGYRSLAEIGALSSVDPQLLEASTERIVVLPYRP
ncbi:helix-hairpin-helix domain-containing protein [Phytoactinopolyspora mesophila]|uniref:Helix-hairpin-helix domain-containing protein n=1 Tax=Phytoactinopolyspora mesophila TaxID=2650750 RepID=A0A7K3M1D8_9ACTN|nr:helix-hairpin-helix domain-containing protein [Phytoactinopolyspora mesophila]NDL57094.1 hypothetical protein [Phytoactinopolyspora mesophila]